MEEKWLHIRCEVKVNVVLYSIQVSRLVLIPVFTGDIRGVRLAKNDFGSVFGSVCPKTAVFGSVLVLPN